MSSRSLYPSCVRMLRSWQQVSHGLIKMFMVTLTQNLYMMKCYVKLHRI